MPFVQINDIVHRYVDHGSKSSPVMLFANSLGSDLRIWDDVASRLEGDFHVVRYDFRGHGLTDASEPPYSADGLAEDLARLLEILELHQAVVCGVSVGGLIAQAAALNYPERVLGLVLCDTGARIGSVQSWQQRIDLVQANGLVLTSTGQLLAIAAQDHPGDLSLVSLEARQFLVGLQVPDHHAAVLSAASPNASAPRTPTPAAATPRYSTATAAVVTTMARGITRRGSRTSSPRVAIRP